MVDVILTTLALQMLLVWAYHNRGRFVTAAAGNPESASESTSDAFDHVREAIKGNLDPEAGLAAFEVWLAWRGKQQSKLEANIPELEQLKGVERELVHLTLQGMTPKEIARFKGVSGFHIYNVRSKVRRKLRVPESMELEDFLRKGLSESNENQQFTPPHPPSIQSK